MKEYQINGAQHVPEVSSTEITAGCDSSYLSNMCYKELSPIVKYTSECRYIVMDGAGRVETIVINHEKDNPIVYGAWRDLYDKRE